MRTATSSGRAPARLAAAFAVAALAAAAAAAAASPRPAAASAPGDPEIDSGTCVLCHTDARYRAGFSHRELEESADGCMTCHEGAEAHLAARGGKGSISNPAAIPGPAERAVCLQCHDGEEVASEAHLAPKGKAARCGDCHTLHGGALPVRARPGPDLRPGRIPGAAVRPPRQPFLRGAVEAGWRFVAGEEGRYDQDVDLDGGPRLFSLAAEGGLDGNDPSAPRAEGSLTGLGDPHESLLLRARASDLWKAEVRARRDRFPFLGGEGRHPGETERSSLSASADLRLSPLARAGFGYDLLRTEGEVRGTLLDAGAVIPVEGDADRTSHEGWASLDLRGRDWHAGFRQGWLREAGDERKDREASSPGGPDFLAFDDDSTMKGPKTSLVAGADLLGGRLSVEVRGSRASLDREVDASEVRRGTIAGSPFTRSVRSSGDRERVIDSQAVDLAFEAAERWEIEAGADRRALHEEGEVLVRTVTDAGGGPVASTDAADDDAAQRYLREYAGVRHRPADGVLLRTGVERLADRVRVEGGGPRATLRSTGLYLAGEARPAPEWTLAADLRTADADDSFTPLTPRDRNRYSLRARYADDEGWRGAVEYRRSELSSRESGLASRGDELRLSAGGGRPGEITVDLGYSIRRQTLEIDTLAFVAGVLRGGEAESRIRSHLLDLRLGFPVAPRVRAYAGGDWVLDRGSLGVRALDAVLGVRWEIDARWAARLELRRREYDELGADRRDYEASLLELAVEYRF